MSEGLILRDREGNRVSVRVLDHHGVDSLATRWLSVRCDARSSKHLCDVVDVAHDQGARALTCPIGRSVDLQPSPSWQLPFHDLWHGLITWAEKLLVPL